MSNPGARWNASPVAELIDKVRAEIYVKFRFTSRKRTVSRGAKKEYPPFSAKLRIPLQTISREKCNARYPW